ncbi:hypothetical protein IWQ60_008341 [Tieghemiomyces parasiticus]|uniref:Nucleolar protein 12 n=1 Tax=Tieghemiomyces parasiticus TaxID=78921 RepID=A0A9W7ZT40_9FUNG|nr:hypothetical protein IWQ60_008341 [Tieghemiomyces parasiticus]
MNNTSLLTQGAAIYAKKRSFRKQQVEEIKFDLSDRKEYLTGFSKRKKQRKEFHEEKLKQRHKEELKNARLERREHLKKQAEQNVAEQRAYYAALAGEDDTDGSEEEEGSEDESTPAGPDVQEFETPETLTTVTVVTDLDLDDFQSINKPKPTAASNKPTGRSEATPKKPALTRAPKPKRRTFRYENKTTRLLENSKQYNKHQLRVKKKQEKVKRQKKN